MALEQRSISPDDKKRLADTESAALRMFQDIDDLKTGLKDLIKNVAEEMNIKPQALMKAYRLVHKNKIADEKEMADDVQEILHLGGHVV